MTISSNNLRILLTLAALTITMLASAFRGKPSSEGFVFLDGNSNGVYDKGEKLLRNTGVSDGDTVVWTGRNGRFSLDSQNDLFVIAPDGYQTSLRGLQNRRREGNQIPLYRAEPKDAYRMALVGDIQVDDEEQMDFARRTVISELSSRTDLDGVIHLGDLVNDKPESLPEAAGLLESLTVPSWTVIGNHDLDYRGSGDSSFRKAVGNDVLVFERGKFCFVLLDDVNSERYCLPEGQVRLLRQLNRHYPEDVVFVLCQHVPLGGLANKDEVISVLGGRTALVFSAHTHSTFRKEWSGTLSEIGAGAACGSWWTGERDSWGLPVALMQCGAPRGYYVLDLSYSKKSFIGKRLPYSFSYKTIGADPASQAEVWVKGENSSDSEVRQLADLPDGRIIVNVFSGGDSTKVELSVDGVVWIPMEKVNMIDPAIARIAYMNKNGGYPSKYSRRQPVRKTASPHLWSADLPDAVFVKPVTVRFRVKDSSGLKPFEFSRQIAARSVR